MTIAQSFQIVYGQLKLKSDKERLIVMALGASIEGKNEMMNNKVCHKETFSDGSVLVIFYNEAGDRCLTSYR